MIKYISKQMYESILPELSIVWVYFTKTEHCMSLLLPKTIWQWSWSIPTSNEWSMTSVDFKHTSQSW